MRILTVLGTRPEAIKLAPVIKELDRRPSIESIVCVTGQHHDLVDPILELFEVTADEDLGVMSAGQSLSSLAARVLERLDPVMADHSPDWVLVQGDTTSTFAAALGAYHRRIPVGHVEAGLRTGDLHAPWPEEGNRVLTSRLASTHFAPTERARSNLLAEGVPDSRIILTGNTGVDAVTAVAGRLADDTERASAARAGVPALDPGAPLVLVTGHRRENLDGGLAEVCDAIAEISRRSDAQIVFPVHPNPQVRSTVDERLGGRARVHLLAPIDYATFVWLMSTADLIISDSGGIQEEAPTFGVPMLVTRETTERPEAVEAGFAELVGSNAQHIVTRALDLLRDQATGERLASRPNPFGDGMAARRVVDVLVAQDSNRE